MTWFLSNVVGAVLLLARLDAALCVLLSRRGQSIAALQPQVILSPYDASVSSGSEANLNLTSSLSRPTAGFAEAWAGPKLKSKVAKKPWRIIRGGYDDKNGTVEDAEFDRCGKTSKVNSSSDLHMICPGACPFYAQNLQDDDFCTFECVREPECRLMNPQTQIGDRERGVCRSCVVDGCSVCDLTVNVDRCAACQSAYVLGDDGLCYFRFRHWGLMYVGYALLVLVFVAIVWLGDMAIRPVYNIRGLSHAISTRHACKLHQPKTPGSSERKLWPLWATNMCKDQVAGPGMMLHFNFQVVVMVWGLFVAVLWMGLCVFVDGALWKLGMRPFGTPRSNCIVVAWGYETQQRLMWTKVMFLAIVYVVSFLGAILYSIYQLRTFQATDYAYKTMKDYVAMLTGLPTSITGARNVEDELKAEIQKQLPALAGKVVGVSVAWDLSGYEEQLQTFAQVEFDKEEQMSAEASKQEVRTPIGVPLLRQALMAMEAQVLDVADELEEDKSPFPTSRSSQSFHLVEPLEDILANMQVSGCAFVVFRTEEDRDEAVKVGSFQFDEATVTIREKVAEPDTVLWDNFGGDTYHHRAQKLVASAGIIALACLFWAVVFYSPYAYYVMTFNYENGRQPGFLISLAFSMVVAVGNVIMYEVCARISDWVGFRFRDQREACYMVLYTVACMLNIALDWVSTYLTVEMIMNELGFRNYFGVPFQEISSFTTKFETYGMQRSLAENTFTYAFPSTYLFPFLFEPIASITIPYLFGRFIVKSHIGVQGRDAEDRLLMAPMDMGRYADILLNAILGILIFYFPGAYTWQLFLGLVASHAYIYAFDKFKVLREIPACNYASFDIEWCCQHMLAPIVGIVASCFVFKANCEPGFHCIAGIPLLGLCSAAWCLHVVVHLLVLRFVVPLFSLKRNEDPEAGKRYEEVAAATPSTWFSRNLVHCLRSQAKFGHSPPCTYMTVGKEALMKTNPSIGCYYEEQQHAPESISMFQTLGDCAK